MKVDILLVPFCFWKLLKRKGVEAIDENIWTMMIVSRR